MWFLRFGVDSIKLEINNCQCENCKKDRNVINNHKYRNIQKARKVVHADVEAGVSWRFVATVVRYRRLNLRHIVQILITYAEI